MERIKEIKDFLNEHIYIAICIMFLSGTIGFFLGEMYYDGIVNQYAIYQCYVKMTNQSFNITINSSIYNMSYDMEKYVKEQEKLNRIIT